MRISAKADYAVRAAVELAAAGEEPVKGEKLANDQDIPLQFLEHILLELKHARIVRARRGAKGGYWLAKPADEVTEYPGNAAKLSDVWVAVRSSLRGVLETVTLADLRDGNLPEHVTELAAEPGAWDTR